MEKINNAIKLAMLTNKDDIQKLWMISDTLRQLNADEDLICAGICQNTLKNEFISQNELRKIIGAVPLMIVININSSDKNLENMTVPEQVLFIANNFVESELNNGNLTQNQINKMKNFINQINNIKKTPFIDEKINIEKINEIIKSINENIEKSEKEINKQKEQNKENKKPFSLLDYDIVCENGHYVAYDKNKEIILTDDTRRDVENSLIELFDQPQHNGDER